MAETVGSLKNSIAGFLGTTTSTFVVNGVDLLLQALNNARRTAERAHDFNYSQTNLLLSIASSGGSILSAISGALSLTVSGTLSPSGATGAYQLKGLFNNLPFYTQTTGGVQYFVWNNITGWIISANGFLSANYWGFTTTNTNTPNGAYSAHGTNTGTATVSGAGAVTGVKRIQNVSLVQANGDVSPVEFMTNDAWNARLRRLVGRQPYNANQSLYQMGVWSDNPVAVQQGLFIYLVPASQFTFPVTAQLSCTQWLPDYTVDGNADYLTKYAPEYLQWQGILEGNKLSEEFVQRVEGKLTEAELQTFAGNAWASLLEWDRSISDNTSTPVAPPAPPQPQAA